MQNCRKTTDFYLCLICENYFLCNLCYLKQEKSESHELDHPLQIVLHQHFVLTEFGQENFANNSYTCGICNQSGFSRDEYVAHVKESHKTSNVRVHCSICLGPFRLTLPEHMERSHSGVKISNQKFTTTMDTDMEFNTINFETDDNWMSFFNTDLFSQSLKRKPLAKNINSKPQESKPSANPPPDTIDNPISNEDVEVSKDLYKSLREICSIMNEIKYLHSTSYLLIFI